MALLAARAKDGASMLRLAYREGLLQQGALYLDHLDHLPEEDAQASVWLKTLAHLSDEYGWLTFLGTEKAWSHPDAFDDRAFYSIEFSLPDATIQRAAWERALTSSARDLEASWPEQLVSRFSLTPGQIEAAAKWAERRCVIRHDATGPSLTALYAACRHQSCHRLGELALKIEPRYGWNDLVLPENTLAQLHEICSHVRHRHRVLGEWRFERKLSYGKGLSALFAGPSGTGKTMAAEVIASELQLDLYKIDLSTVVSKYIGEPEKNLAKIFAEAESSNAILFFDEADALFGKRTKVSDAHDRYANIETSYLLQKMESYAGVAILATNFQENIDEAFARRIRFLVDFPFPDAERRQQIWRTHFPGGAYESRHRLRLARSAIADYRRQHQEHRAERGLSGGRGWRRDRDDSCAARGEAGVREDRQALERERVRAANGGRLTHGCAMGCPRPHPPACGPERNHRLLRRSVRVARESTRRRAGDRTLSRQWLPGSRRERGLPQSRVRRSPPPGEHGGGLKRDAWPGVDAVGRVAGKARGRCCGRCVRARG
jgi:hypothetical protein